MVQSLSKYSAEATKAALAESTLGEAQIRRILSSKGLKDEELEKTTATILDTIETNKNTVAQTGNTASTTGLGLAFKGLAIKIREATLATGQFLLTNPLGWATLAIGALVGVTTAVYAYNEAQKKAFNDNIEETKNAISELESVNSEIDSLTTSIDELDKKIKELNGLDPIANADDISNLESEKTLLEAELALLKEKKALQEETANKEAIESLTQEQKSKYATSGTTTTTQYVAGDIITKTVDVPANTTEWEELNLAMQHYNQLAEDKIGLEEKLNSLKADGKENTDEYRNTAQALKELDTEMIDTRTHASELQTSLLGQVGGLTATDDKTVELRKNVEGSINAYTEWSSAVNGTTDALNKNTSAQQENANKTGILSFTEQISQVQTLSDGLDQLAKIYKDVQDGADFDYTSILNNEDFTNTFGKYTEEYDNFIQTITNSPNDIKASQDAFNKLASAYIYNQEALKNVTNESKDATVQMLEQMGVSNALEVVEQQLAINTANLADAQENLNELKEEGVDSSIDLADATATELVELIHNAEQLGYNVDALKLYLQQKIQTNQITLSTSGDIQNLANLCSRLGIAGTALEKFAKLKNATLGAPYKDGQSSSKVPTLGVSLNAMNNPNAFMNEVNNSYENSVQGIMDELNNALLDFVSADVKNVGVDFTDKSNNSSSKDSKTTFDWIETKISRIQRQITNFGKTVSATWLSWSTRNNALLSELSAVNEEIVTQKQAYEKYLSLANSVGLSEPYKTLVESGGLRIDTITDENLKEKIQLYQDYYEKYLAALDAYNEGATTLAEKTREQFDLAASEYDSYISTVTSKADILNAYIDQVEARGHMVSKSYYEELKKVEQSNISSLQSKYSQLTSILNNAVANGTIKESSEEYNNMKSEIDGVQQALIEANTALIEYDNSMRDLDWEVFDKIQDKISGVIEEADFLINLMSDEKMFDGGITEYGQATMGLHAVNYETYMKQSKEYGTELLEINKQLADDPNNWILIERREDLLEAQREAILAAQDEQQAILDLKQEGYDELLDSLDSAIEKYNDLMDAERDLYDYEKSVSEQTANIASLRKQLMAYSGDNSESAKSKIQQITVDLEKAEQELQETEMDKNIQDRQQLLTALKDEAELFVSEKMDNQDEILKEVLADTNNHIDSIKDTLDSQTSSVGITLSEEMNKIFGGEGSITSIESGISNTLVDIKALIQSMVDNSNKTASGNIGGSNTPSVPSVPSPAPSTPQSTPSTPSVIGNDGGSTGNNKWGSWFIPKKSYYPKDKLNIEYAIGDRLAYHDFDPSFEARASYYQAMGLGSSSSYKGTAKQNLAMIAEMKKHGMRQGGTIGSLIKSTGEDGFVLARTGEEILSLDKIKELGFTFEKMKPIVDTMKMLPNVQSNVSNKTMDIKVDIGDIQMYGVNDPEQFAAQLKGAINNNSSVRKMLNDVTLGNALGHNSLTRYTR